MAGSLTNTRDARRLRSQVLGERFRKTVSIALAVLFTGGLAAETYGWHHCPRHHPAGEQSEDASVQLASHATWNSADEGDADASGASEDRCTCVGSCHAGAATPLPGFAPAPRQPADVVAAVERSVPNLSVLPRRAPYLFPLPNAPPVL